MAAGGLPVTISPNETRSVPVHVTVLGEPGSKYRQTVTLFADGPFLLHLLQGAIHGDIRRSPDG